MKKIKKTAIFILLFAIVYSLSVLIIPFITIKAETVQTIREINIYVKTNGIHTDIIVPLKNKYFDWNTKISQKNTKKYYAKMQYVAIGWGDKGFYLNTPTWSDLTFKTAFKAAFGLSSTAIHTTYYSAIEENNSCVKIKITPKQYNKLCNYICNSALLKQNKFLSIKTNALYGNHDAFYEARGSYNLFKTCNTWTNNALKKTGLNACLWTVTDNQILIKNK